MNGTYKLEIHVRANAGAIAEALLNAVGGSGHPVKDGWCLTDANGNDWLVLEREEEGCVIYSPVVSSETPGPMALAVAAVRGAAQRIDSVHIEVEARGADDDELVALAIRAQELFR